MPPEAGGSNLVPSLSGRPLMDAFGSDPHITLAIFCIGIAMILAAIVQAEVIADHHDEIKSGARRGKKWWQK